MYSVYTCIHVSNAVVLYIQIEENTLTKVHAHLSLQGLYMYALTVTALTQVVEDVLELKKTFLAVHSHYYPRHTTDQLLSQP